MNNEESKLNELHNRFVKKLIDFTENGVLKWEREFGFSPMNGDAFEVSRIISQLFFDLEESNDEPEHIPVGYYINYRDSMICVVQFANKTTKIVDTNFYIFIYSHTLTAEVENYYAVKVDQALANELGKIISYYHSHNAVRIMQQFVSEDYTYKESTEAKILNQISDYILINTKLGIDPDNELDLDD